MKAAKTNAKRKEIENLQTDGKHDKQIAEANKLAPFLRFNKSLNIFR